MNPIYVEAGKLDPNQEAIYNLKLDSKFIVRGCAGSGKTSLALLRMYQLLKSETETSVTPFYYVSFVRELVECMRKEIAHCPDGEPRFNDYAITYENWARGEISSWMRKKFGIHSRSTMYKEPYTVNVKGRMYPRQDIKVNPQPDYLFVDECQDLDMEAVDSLMESAQKGISFYGDDDQQIMAWGRRCPVSLETIREKYGLKIHDLIFNYRLPKEIALFAEQLGGRPELSRHCKSPYHEKPFLIKVSNQDDAYAYMKGRIRNIGLQDVGIAFQTNEEVRNGYKALRRMLGDKRVSGAWNIKSQGSPDDYDSLRETQVKIMTYQKIKGQQFETVFLFVSGELSPEMIKRFYVGATRAERFLYVLYTDPMPAVLRQIPTCFYSTTDEVGDFKDLYIKPKTQDEKPKTQDELLDAMLDGKSVVDVGF